MSDDDTRHAAKCNCGRVDIATSGPPIASAACYCASCREAGRELETLPGASPVLQADGGSAFIQYRKDHVRCVKGREHLAEHRLTPVSKTRRVVATCCNSAMFLDFTGGHCFSAWWFATLPVIEGEQVLKNFAVDAKGGAAPRRRSAGREFWL